MKNETIMTNNEENVTKSNSSVKAQLAGITEGRRPKRVFWFNITMRNTDKQPRWFLISRLSKPLVEYPYIWGVEAAYFESNDSVRYAAFYGTPAFTAFLLPGDGEITLEGWPISTFEPRVEALHIWKASDILIEGSESAFKEWLPLDLQCPRLEFVKEAGKREVYHSYQTDGRKEVKFEITGIQKKWVFQINDPKASNRKTKP